MNPDHFAAVASLVVFVCRECHNMVSISAPNAAVSELEGSIVVRNDVQDLGTTTTVVSKSEKNVPHRKTRRLICR